MRSFIGIDLLPHEKLNLEAWRQKALPEVASHKLRDNWTKQDKKRKDQNTSYIPYAVPTANFHITLCFTGNITPQQHEALCIALGNIQQRCFDLTLDSTGFWARPKIVFAAPSELPDELMSLATACSSAASQVGIAVEKREYRPHVTLVRKAIPTMSLPLFQPNLTCSVTKFHLFESFSDKQGVHYPIRHSWSLTSSLSIREQLKRGIVDEG